tara:strand:+ start:1148 stop:1441 length:294 start_codon:yes stop_codon:yes gene_type:complete
MAKNYKPSEHFIEQLEGAAEYIKRMTAWNRWMEEQLDEKLKLHCNGCQCDELEEEELAHHEACAEAVRHRNRTGSSQSIKEIMGNIKHLADQIKGDN